MAAASHSAARTPPVLACSYCQTRVPVYRTHLLGRPDLHLVLDPALAPQVLRGEGLIARVALPGLETLLGEQPAAPVQALPREQQTPTCCWRSAAGDLRHVMDPDIVHIARKLNMDGADSQHCCLALGLRISVRAGC